jgi:hypothetical protein
MERACSTYGEGGEEEYVYIDMIFVGKLRGKRPVFIFFLLLVGWD